MLEIWAAVMLSAGLCAAQDAAPASVPPAVAASTTAAAPAAEAPGMPPARTRLGPALRKAKLRAYDRSGKLLDLRGFLAFIGRADSQSAADPARSGVAITPPDERYSARPVLAQEGADLILIWDRLPNIRINLPWPVAEDGFSTVWLDKNADGYADGDVIAVNEEIAITHYRRFKESLRKHVTDWDPIYKPDAEMRKAAARAKDLLAEAHAQKTAAARAGAFDAAMRAVSAAEQKMLFQHGLQIAGHEKFKSRLRFGLVLDESLLQRLDHYPRVVQAIKNSGADWVQLVFRSNPEDFTYADLHSFNEYDAIVKDIRNKGLKIMGTVLDTGQWPAGMTSAVYAERVKNLVIHYKEDIRSWEVGSELNGDWLGGSASPLAPDQVYRIYSAGAARVKEIDPGLETVASLYWWEGTAPDDEHAMLNWIRRYSRMGFGRGLDVLSISLQPDDNPVGVALESIFERVSLEMPDQRLMLGSIGYVEKDKLQGYWWFRPDDVPAAREDLVAFLAAAACALPRSLGGGFWWQTLEQMIPSKGRTTDLYRAYSEALGKLSR